ncbi:nitroreductase family protein [Nanoarchaeota archaeon]|nr:MAG: nitroreductase family protein [Nanoarchaeota archaeon]
MDIFKVIKGRRSIRRYVDRKVSRLDIVKILDAARWAPSAGNLQNWYFIVVRDKGKKLQLSEACLGQEFVALAPVVIVACADNRSIGMFYGERGERLYSIQNVAAAVQNMLLMAHSLGLGSCWVGAFDTEMVKNILRIPDNVEPQAVVTIGYPGEKPPAPKRKDLDRMVFLEEWGKRF